MRQSKKRKDTPNMRRADGKPSARLFMFPGFFGSLFCSLFAGMVMCFSAYMRICVCVRKGREKGRKGERRSRLFLRRSAPAKRKKDPAARRGAAGSNVLCRVQESAMSRDTAATMTATTTIPPKIYGHLARFGGSAGASGAGPSGTIGSLQTIILSP